VNGKDTFSSAHIRAGVYSNRRDRDGPRERRGPHQHKPIKPSRKPAARLPTQTITLLPLPTNAVPEGRAPARHASVRTRGSGRAGGPLRRDRGDPGTSARQRLTNRAEAAWSRNRHPSSRASAPAAIDTISTTLQAGLRSCGVRTSPSRSGRKQAAAPSKIDQGPVSAKQRQHYFRSRFPPPRSIGQACARLVLR